MRMGAGITDDAEHDAEECHERDHVKDVRGELRDQHACGTSFFGADFSSIFPLAAACRLLLSALTTAIA